LGKFEGFEAKSTQFVVKKIGAPIKKANFPIVQSFFANKNANAVSFSLFVREGHREAAQPDGDRHVPVLRLHPQKHQRHEENSGGDL
jgi:hypothetical protein